MKTMGREGREAGRRGEKASGSVYKLDSPTDEILEQIDTPIVVLDQAGRIVVFNAACRALTGYDKSDALGRRVWDFLLLPEEIDAVRGVFDETRSGKIPTIFVNYWLTKGGEKRLLKWSNSRFRLNDGPELYIFATGIDITDMATAEHALADREAHLRSIVDTSPEPIITIDTDGLIRSFSSAAVSAFGYKPEEIIGQNINILMAEPYASEHQNYLKRYLETNVPHIIGNKRLVSGRRRDGTIFPIRLSVGEFLQHDRRYFVGFIEDLSVEEEVRRRLTELRSELDRHSRISALGELATGIAHELNQPLTAAAAFGEAADLMLESQGLKAGHPVRRELERSLKEIHRTAEIIRNIREFIRKGTPDLKLHDVNGLMEDALALALSGADSDSLETEIDLAPDLPQVELDRVQIQQVILNLIRNALEVMSGGKLQRLGISTGLKRAYVEIRVSDTGPGIDPAMEGRLFEAFATNKKDGLGLGLAIAKTIVEGHRGELTLRPNDPHGAVFTVRLPLESAGRK